ncbi:MAG TPA: phosphatidylserine decarboxylase [Pyrinomonadaceae bacterium]|nr:phosphatidylserine decarboxylase [Pyrinomonadaceae bacterium]
MFPISDIRHLSIMVKEGIPFVLIPFAIALIFAFFQVWSGVALFVGLALFMAYFFRDPKRTIPTEADIIVSAADGKVTRVEDRENGKFVSVFLSPVDVHINRAPIAGRVVKVELLQGRKAPATSNEASQTNERNAITIEGEKMTVICTQIVGILARRIVCWSKAGDNLELGEKYGLIKFGSRTDLLMPKNVEILVKVGDRVVGGETVIGKLIEYTITENAPVNYPARDVFASE